MADCDELSLPDLIRADLDILFVGINPGVISAKRGHYYAGPTNHFWKCLYMSGLVREPCGCEDDKKLLAQGIGFVNVVRRTTRSSSDLRPDELRKGTVRLRCMLAAYKPRICVFNGKGIFKVFSNQSSVEYGLQPRVGESEQSLFYVLPSSSARCSQFPTFFDKVPFFVDLKRTKDQLECSGAAAVDCVADVVTPPPTGSDRSRSEASDSQQSLRLEDFSVLDAASSADQPRLSPVSESGPVSGEESLATMWDGCGSFLKYSPCTSAAMFGGNSDFPFDTLSDTATTTASHIRPQKVACSDSPAQSFPAVGPCSAVTFDQEPQDEEKVHDSHLALPLDFPTGRLAGIVPIPGFSPPDQRRGGLTIMTTTKDDPATPKRCLLPDDVAAHVQEAIDTVIDRARSGPLEMPTFAHKGGSVELRPVAVTHPSVANTTANYIFQNFGQIPYMVRDDMTGGGSAGAGNYGAHPYSLNSYAGQQLQPAYLSPYSVPYRDNAATFTPQAFGSMSPSPWGSAGLGHPHIPPFTCSSDFSPSLTLPLGMVPHSAAVQYLQNGGIDADSLATSRGFEASLNQFSDLSAACAGGRSSAASRQQQQQQQFRESFPGCLPSTNAYTSQGNNSGGFT